MIYSRLKFIVTFFFSEMNAFTAAYNAGWENVTDMEFTSAKQPAFVSKVNVNVVSRKKLSDPIETFKCLLNSEIWREFFRLWKDTLFQSQEDATYGMYRISRN